MRRNIEEFIESLPRIEPAWSMSIGFRISSLITGVLTVASVGGYLWLEWLWEARNSFGPVVFIFWSLLTFFVTLPSALITFGIWIAHNQKSRKDDSLHL